MTGAAPTDRPPRRTHHREASPPAPRPVLVPGETCWRIGRAARAAFLIDNEDFYAALVGAVSRARRSILILGWAFDPRTRMVPDGQEGPADPDEIGRILLGLIRARPDLDVRLLIWKSSLAVNGSHDFLRHRASRWFAGTPIRFQLADDTPFGACHHQKLVVVDDRVAFCGGGDIVTNRWDTRRHLHEDPRRIRPDRASHAARHEVTMMVEGPPARDLGDLFRKRWRDGVGEALEPSTLPQGDPWPGAVAAQLHDVEMAIARTEPGWRGRPLVDEIRELALACIADARRSIYLENQYFTSPVVTAALAARLAERDGPEVILVVARSAPSWFDRLTMDRARNPMIRRLRRADRFGRFRAYSPSTSNGGGIIVHSKVSIFDDRIARVGSANLNNRSGGFDTECELAVRADDDAGRGAISAFRDRLVSHFLAVPVELMAQATHAHGGLAGAIDALNGEGRLAAIAPQASNWWEALVSAYSLGDPSEAGDSWRPGRRREHLLAQAARAVRTVADRRARGD